MRDTSYTSWKTAFTLIQFESYRLSNRIQSSFGTNVSGL